MTSRENPGSLKLSIGMRVQHRGTSWQVTHLDGMEVRLANITGETETLPFYRFVQLPSIRRLTERHQAELQTAFKEHLDAVFDSIPAALKDAALERLDHLHEAVTGFRSGSPGRAEPGEPRAEYDPARTTEETRFEAKAKELERQNVKVAARTLRHQRDEYQRRGLVALIDSRKLRKSLPLGRHPTEVIQAAKAVISEATNASTVNKKKHVGDIQRKLKADMKAGKVQLHKGIPSFSGIVRLLNKLSVNQYTYDSAKLRRSIAGRPQRAYHMLVPTRVGEYVIIDASPWDVWGFDSITGKKVRHRLVVAIEVFSRCILSARFFEDDPKGIDVTFMLYEVLVHSR